MGRLIHFEINASDPQRSARFYERVLGWTVQGWGGDESYLLVTTGGLGLPGINGAIQSRGEPGEPGHNPQPVVNTANVDNLDAAVEAVKANGGQIVAGPMEIPGIGMIAYALDPDGITFGMLQPFPNQSM